MLSHASRDSLYREHPNGQGVLVTGCSSGIGRATAIHLARRGFTVFATVRKPNDVESLRQLNEPNLVPTYPLDLTKPEHIPHVVEVITDELRQRGQEGLYAVVNNAGGSLIAPVELMDLGSFRVELETRIVGPIALLQALLPMVRQAQGRILWIVTPALFPVPYVSSIHACDFAVNCIARTLHIELTPWGIPTILIRCGGIQTAAVGKGAPKAEDSMQRRSQELSQMYAQTLTKQETELAEFDKKRTAPEKVARVVFTALCARKPRRRYMVGHMVRTAAMLEYLPHPLVDRIIARMMAG